MKNIVYNVIDSNKLNQYTPTPYSQKILCHCLVLGGGIRNLNQYAPGQCPEDFLGAVRTKNSLPCLVLGGGIRNLKWRKRFMKKLLTMALSLALAFTAVGCGKSDDADKKSEGVMTYAEYDAAELKSEVTIEAYVQAKQSWWDNKATLYTQDKDGAYFIYNMPCSEEEYAKLTTGTKIKVTGFKEEWSGEIEIMDVSKFEIMTGSYIAKAVDVTSDLGSDNLIKRQNQLVSFKGMTVEESEDKDGNKAPYLYNWDGSGTQADNSDLYFNVSKDGKTYTFTVESYLCDNTTEVYKAVESLKVGDVIDMEGFLYWYKGVNPHITSVTKAK